MVKIYRGDSFTFTMSLDIESARLEQDELEIDTEDLKRHFQALIRHNFYPYVLRTTGVGAEFWGSLDGCYVKGVVPKD